MKLNLKAFALRCAVVWGLLLFCFTRWIIFFEASTGDITLIASCIAGTPSAQPEGSSGW
ncbi:MAG: hypothetical protein QGD90_09225 [Candidatus Hydrogenedentes bacterium]|nr:hypothetical protein [Candidatus Hydrogenedentota bacterium]